MKDLIAALTIFLKYMEDSEDSPTNCSHDMLWVNCDPAKVTEEDKKTLEAYGFHPGYDDYEGGFYSFRFGSC